MKTALKWECLRCERAIPAHTAPKTEEGLFACPECDSPLTVRFHKDGHGQTGPCPLCYSSGRRHGRTCWCCSGKGEVLYAK